MTGVQTCALPIFPTGAALLKDLHRQLIDPRQIGRDVEIGIIAQGDRQGRTAEVDLRLRAVDGLTKRLIKIGDQIGYGYYRGSAITSTR